MSFEAGFLVCAGLIAYIYVGYPACVFLLSTMFERDVKRAMIQPTVTVVIAAYNEEAEIAATVVNKLEQGYPSDLLKVLVISDGSTDGTDKIVRDLIPRYRNRLMLIRQEPREGKTQAINVAMQHIDSEIVVCADANSIYSADAIQHLVNNFADPTVGYVTGQMIYGNPAEVGIGAGSSSYMSYENALRRLESKLGSVVGVDGGIDAVRRRCYVPMRADQLPDLVLPLSVVEQGRRVVYEPRARVFEMALSDASKEFRMRVRVSLRSLWALFDKRSLLNPFRYPLFGWQVLSHKILRYMAFVPLVGLFLCSCVIWNKHWSYSAMLSLQLGGYLTAALGHLLRRNMGVSSHVLVPYYFVVLNLACVIAFVKFIRGQKIVLWTPRVGT